MFVLSRKAPLIPPGGEGSLRMSVGCNNVFLLTRIPQITQISFVGIIIRVLCAICGRLRDGWLNALRLLKNQ